MKKDNLLSPLWHKLTSFKKIDGDYEIDELFLSLNYLEGIDGGGYQASSLVRDFMRGLDKAEFACLYKHVKSHLLLKYYNLDDEEVLRDPEEDCFEYLHSDVISFASEFDLSEIGKHTVDHYETLIKDDRYSIRYTGDELDSAFNAE